MITSLQFDEAIKIITDYKSQVENGVVKIKEKAILVDIQDKITFNFFLILQHYYEDILGKKLEWNHLKSMELDELKYIDFNCLRNYRGFGLVSEKKFRNLIYTCSIISSKI